MGGDTITPPISSSEESSDDQFPNSPWSGFSVKSEDGTTCKANDELNFRELDHVCSVFASSSSSELEADRRRKYMVYREVLQSYDDLRVRVRSGCLNEAKSKVLSYHPGAWIGNMNGMQFSDYDVPETTKLVLLGPKGSGKSSLVNRISRALEDDKFAPERAQVSYNSSVGHGTCFLQEYMVPRGSSTFCLYDTRSLSDDSSENSDLMKNWMTRGVCHGELVLRNSDIPSLRNIMMHKTREKKCQSSKIRMVNFVIFVVDGVAVLKSLESSDNGMTQYMQTITKAFDCPYLSFKGLSCNCCLGFLIADYFFFLLVKMINLFVVTHGDLLSLGERVRVRVHLGELLGIPPAKQIFDIPGNSDASTELTIVDLLHYSLEHADRNFPFRYPESSFLTMHDEVNPQNELEEDKENEKENAQDEESSYQTIQHVENNPKKSQKESSEVFITFLVIVFFLSPVPLAAFICLLCFLFGGEAELQIDWHTIRHIW